MNKRYRATLTVFLVLFSLILSYGQTQKIDYEAPKEYILGGIEISGVEFLDKNVLVNLSGLRIGQNITIPSDKISNVIDKYWKQGLFSDVKVLIDSVHNDSIFLNIYLKERARLNKVEIQGVRKGRIEDIKEKIDLKRGSQVTDNRVNNTVNIIKKYYTEKGFFNVEVDVKKKYDTIYGNRVDLILDVDKNNRVKIDDITFDGNKAFSDRRLRRVMKKTKKVNLNIFKASKLVEEEFKEDRKKLSEFYNEHGYRDFEILDTNVIILNDKRILLNIDIFEGDKYYFGDIEWVGNTKYPDHFLNKVLGITKGDVYDYNLLQKRLNIDEDAVSSLYMDDGYLFFNVRPIEAEIHNDTIDLEMRMYEGEQATIDEVIIKGNTRTNEHVIRREIRTRPGKLFSKSEIIRTVRELAQLGHFDPETITPNPIPNPEEGTVDIEYNLEEKSNDQLEVSGGWGAGMFVGTIGLKFSNFSARNIFDLSEWRPIPEGDGQSLSLRAQTNGKYYQNYSISFTEPWFGGKKPNSFSVSFYYSKINRMGYSYLSSYNRQYSDQFMTILGGSVGLGRRLQWPDDYFTMYNGLSYSRYGLNNYSYGSFPFDNGVSHNISLTTTFSRNSQDQLIYPRRGSNFSLSLELTPPYSLFKEEEFWIEEGPEGERVENVNEKFRIIEHHKWTVKGTWFTPLIENLVLMTKMEFGIKGFYNNKIGHSPFEGYLVGGDGMGYYSRMGQETIGLRGYANYALTPNYKQDNAYNKYTLELRYPFALKPSATIFALAFLEGGNSWYDLKELNPFMVKRAAGIGLRAFLPMFGMLGIDWGYGFDPVFDENGSPQHKGQFHFTIGQQF